MTLPWAVDPEDRRAPVAQLKPAPSKVVPPPAAADPLAAAELPPAEPAAALVVVVLLSLPQAASSRVPDARSATKPARRVIFTPVPPLGSSFVDAGPAARVSGAGVRRSERKWPGGTDSPRQVNGE
jgi:hypothetical protein